MSRVLPNLLSPLQEARLPNLHHAPTFGMEPKVWWLFFRRDLDAYKIRKLSAPQWRRALQIAVTRNIRPHKAAKEVAAITR